MNGPALGPVTSGDDVMVFLPHNRGRSEPITARVVKVARVWVDIEQVWPKGHTHTMAPQRWRMRLDSQYETPGPNPRGAHFLTPEQHEYRERYYAAMAVLREQGIIIERDSPWNSDERRMQLADLLTLADAR